MSTSKTPALFPWLISEGITLTTKKEGQMGGRTVVPQPGKLPSEKTYMVSAKATDALADSSSIVGNLLGGLKHANQIEPAAVTALPGPILMSNAGTALIDSQKKWKRSDRIGDQTGKHIAGLSGTENLILLSGATVMAVKQSLSLTSDFVNVANPTMTAVSGLTAAQSVLSWLTTALFGLYYAFYIVRYGFGLVFLFQGRELREKLLNSDDPLKVLRKELTDRVYEKTRSMKPEEFRELALESGAKWLEKLSKADESGELGKIVDKKAAFETLVRNNPKIITDQIGDYALERGRTNPEQILTLFGTYMLYLNESAKFDAECTRKLGSKVVEAIKTGKTDEIKAAVSYKDSLVMIGKIAIAAISLTALIVGSIFTGGAPLAVILILAAIGGIGLIVLGDGKLLKEHLSNGEFKNRDRVFIVLSLVLSILSVAALVTISVLSGGVVPFLAGLILASIWLAINIKTTHTLWKFDNKKWDMLKVVDPQTYKAFLETNPTQVQIDLIKAKMSEEHRRLLEEEGSIDNLIARLRREQLEYLTGIRGSINND